MKKLFLTILFTLVLSGGAISYEFNRCYLVEGPKELIVNSFDEQNLTEVYQYTINLKSNLITRLSILSDENYRNLKEQDDEFAERVQRHNTKIYEIIFIDSRIIKGITYQYLIETMPVKSVEEISIDLKNNTVSSKSYSEHDFTKKRVYHLDNMHQCEIGNSSNINGSDIASSGSGFFINNKGYFITNNHVVDGCNQSKITFKEESIDAELIATDQNLDLALLRAKVKPKDFLNLSNDPPEKLQKIYVAGYPFGKGLSDDLKFTQGIISAVKGYADNSNQIQIDAAINSGNSGGPIVDEDGNLVAVAVSGLDKSASEGIGFGIKASSVRNFLDVNDIEYSTPGILNFGINANKLNNLLEKSTVYTFCN